MLANTRKFAQGKPHELLRTQAVFLTTVMLSLYGGGKVEAGLTLDVNEILKLSAREAVNTLHSYVYFQICK